MSRSANQPPADFPPADLPPADSPSADSSPADSRTEQASVLDPQLFSQFIEMVGWEEAAQIANDFRPDAEQLAAQIHETLAGKDGPKLALAAHTLKGVCQLFGATQVAVACEAIYRAARAGNLTGLEPLVAEIDVALPLAEAALAHKFASR